MILQALVQYYEALAETGTIAKIGRGKTRVAYALELDEQGHLCRVLTLEEKNEKGKAIPFYLDLPAAVKRSRGIMANFLWDNSAYMLGIDQKKDKPEWAPQCFQAAQKLHKRILGGLDDPFALAITRFFETWDPKKATTCPALAGKYEEVTSGANITFLFQGEYPDKNSLFDRVWQKEYAGEELPDGPEMRCLVTGDCVVPQKVHPAIKGVMGAKSSGAALISYNAPAFCSYGRLQNLNAPVGKYAAFAYTTALNRLISDREHCRRFGDTTVVYWAENAQVQYQDLFSGLLDGNTISDQDISAVIGALASGNACDWNALPVDPDNRFYILGLSPNAARLSMRFFFQNTFGEFAQNFQAHYDRIRVTIPQYEKDIDFPLWKLLKESVNQKSRDKTVSPHIAADTLYAILTGGRYPSTLYQQTQLRIRAEHDINRGKAAIIKGYLIRNETNPIYKEVLTVDLNEQTTYLPYVLGRLFSVLEDLQQKANPGINTTIKDKYFSSACTTPAVVFPTLLKLAEKHLRKLETGSKIYYSKQMNALLGMIASNYPEHLSISDQGVFQLGYYHQTQRRYMKSTDAK